MGTTPEVMSRYTLNALKGWFRDTCVDFSTQLDPSVTAEVKPGTVMHLNDSGLYELGVGSSAVMPLFAFSGSLDPDVTNDGGDPATDKGVWISVGPDGNMMALVATGAYELASTAFVAGTYTPNMPLTSPLAPSANAGLLQEGTIGTDMIVGLVSRGVVDNGYGYDAIAFWPCPIFP